MFLCNQTFFPSPERHVPMPRYSRFAVGALLFVSVLPALAETHEPAIATVLPGGGLIDATGRVGYVAAANGGLEALDLATGDVLWQTVEAQRPLLIANGKLYAQAGVKRNRLRLMAFDLAKKGECLLETDPVVFPDWVVTGDAPGKIFTSHWRMEGDNAILHWQAQTWNSGAGRPTVKIAHEELRSADGAARIDLKTGVVTKLAAEPKPAEPTLKLPKELEHKTIRWQAQVGKEFKALVLDEEKGQEKLTLRSWNLAGKELRPHELLKGKRLVAMPSLDDKFVCVRDAAPSIDEGLATPDKKRFGWSLVSVATGEQTAWFPYEAGAQSFIVHGLKIYVLVAGPVRGPIDRNGYQSRMLKALDLKTGKQVWERPLESKPTAPPPLVRSVEEETPVKQKETAPDKKEGAAKEEPKKEEKKGDEKL